MISKAGKASVEALLSMSEEDRNNVIAKLNARQIYILEGLFAEYEAELNERS